MLVFGYGKQFFFLKLLSTWSKLPDQKQTLHFYQWLQLRCSSVLRHARLPTSVTRRKSWDTSANNMVAFTPWMVPWFELTNVESNTRKVRVLASRKGFKVHMGMLREATHCPTFGVRTCQLESVSFHLLENCFSSGNVQWLDMLRYFRILYFSIV